MAVVTIQLPIKNEGIRRVAPLRKCTLNNFTILLYFTLDNVSIKSLKNKSIFKRFSCNKFKSKCYIVFCRAYRRQNYRHRRI